jgi:hypothetical protein
MHDPAAGRQSIIEKLEDAQQTAMALQQYVLAYLIDHALAEAWTAEFPSARQLAAARPGPISSAR